MRKICAWCNRKFNQKFRIILALIAGYIFQLELIYTYQKRRGQTPKEQEMINIAKYDEIAEKRNNAAYKEVNADLYWAYQVSKRLGTEDLVLSDVKWTKEVAPIVKECRGYGIKQIAFASTWSGAINTIWEFIKNGCTVEGMKEVAIRQTIDPDTYQMIQEKAPAFIIKIN